MGKQPILSAIPFNRDQSCITSCCVVGRALCSTNKTYILSMNTFTPGACLARAHDFQHSPVWFPSTVLLWEIKLTLDGAKLFIPTHFPRWNLQNLVLQFDRYKDDPRPQSLLHVHENWFTSAMLFLGSQCSCIQSMGHTQKLCIASEWMNSAFKMHKWLRGK